MPQVIAPGASTRGYTIAPHDKSTHLDEARAALRQVVRERRDEHGMAALRVLDGTDPLLFGILRSVRPRITAILSTYDADRAAARRDPQNRYLNQSGIQRVEAELAKARDVKLKMAEEDFAVQLQQLQRRLDRKQRELSGQGITQDDMDEADLMARRMRSLGPQYAFSELTEFCLQVAEGSRSRGQLVALLPVLKSAYDYEGTPYTQNSDLLELIELAGGTDDQGRWVEGSLLHGGWPETVVRARQERVGRVAKDLAAFFDAARNNSPVETEMSKKLRDLGLEGSGLPGVGAMERPGLEERDDEGRHKLFPADVPPPLLSSAPEFEDEDDGLNSQVYRPASGVRRGAVSPEQRERDAAMREQQAT